MKRTEEVEDQTWSLESAECGKRAARDQRHHQIGLDSTLDEFSAHYVWEQKELADEFYASYISGGGIAPPKPCAAH